MYKTTRIASLAIGFGAVSILGVGGTAMASPPEERFTDNNHTWLCHEDGFPAPSHCTNIRSKGATGLIRVFPPDDRGPAEGVAGPEADSRPCPHDPGSPDGTWWEVLPGVFVCHHRP